MRIEKIYKYIRVILIPFIPIYFIIFYLKRFFVKQERFNTPIICVGNITTGGTGKTPAVIEFAKMLTDMGYHSGIACRGYRGSMSKEGAVVTDGRILFLTPRQSGDEPSLIAKSLKNIPVAISSNRSKAIHTLTSRFKVDIIIMDDGFQNYSVNKNISIIMIDATNPFGNGLILPAGDLRESKFALKRSDLVIINKANLVSIERLMNLRSRIERISHNKKIFVSVLNNEFLYQINNPERYIQLPGIKDKKILIITGIANPAAFVTEIKKYDPDYLRVITYPDHHFYTLKEIKKFLKKSGSFDLVITTEKDYVKMIDFQFNDKFYVLKIRLLIKEIDIFKNFLKSLLKNIQ